MDEPKRNNRIAKNLSTTIRLQPLAVAVLYALLALGNVLLYWPGGFFLPGSPFEVLGFRDDPIGWWGFVSILLMITFCILAVKIARRARLHGTTSDQQQNRLRRLFIMLVVLAILFTFPNVFIAFLHLTMGIPSGFLYWGQVRAAYEVPFFHLLPMLLLLYWWLSSLVQRPFNKGKGQSERIGIASGAEGVDVKSTVTDWCHEGLLFLGGFFVLAYLIVSIVRPQVSHSINGGMTVVTDFTGLYFYGISGGALLGVLVAIGAAIYWRRRLYLTVDADCVFATNAGFIRFTLWWLPLLVAMVGILAVVFLLATNL